MLTKLNENIYQPIVTTLFSKYSLSTYAIHRPHTRTSTSPSSSWIRLRTSISFDAFILNAFDVFYNILGDNVYITHLADPFCSLGCNSDFDCVSYFEQMYTLSARVKYI